MKLSRLFCLLIFLWTASVGLASEQHVWDALRDGGKVVLIRHSRTISGIGDPAGYSLDNCQSQRYLSEDGKDQSRRMGARFREEAVPVGDVFSSEWCRCYETAELAFGRYELWPALNSFFDDYSTRDRQTEEVRKRTVAYGGDANLILVTHQVNITALTRRGVASGEAVVLNPTGTSFEEVGRIRFD